MEPLKKAWVGRWHESMDTRVQVMSSRNLDLYDNLLTRIIEEPFSLSATATDFERTQTGIILPILSDEQIPLDVRSSIAELNLVLPEIKCWAFQNFKEEYLSYLCHYSYLTDKRLPSAVKNPNFSWDDVVELFR
jgi:hypothetical protein